MVRELKALSTKELQTEHLINQHLAKPHIKRVTLTVTKMKDQLPPEGANNIVDSRVEIPAGNLVETPVAKLVGTQVDIPAELQVLTLADITVSKEADSQVHEKKVQKPALTTACVPVTQIVLMAVP